MKDLLRGVNIQLYTDQFWCNKNMNKNKWLDKKGKIKKEKIKNYNFPSSREMINYH